ncbi:substrate-binding domain-containing protein [Clavibacter phaseoli]|uniref:substrate-binding domain-containing protein n=1 Tax=Clavibacter phaseoli TaxID=1734031 RepID=UPI002B266DEE|nr:substrate-binding domain-containing protein [Clavibacter phaseoli]
MPRSRRSGDPRRRRSAPASPHLRAALGGSVARQRVRPVEPGTHDHPEQEPREQRAAGPVGPDIAALRAGRLPRALVCASDQLALALVDLLRAEGVDVPGDVVVTGFDGILAGLLSTPRLTTVRQPMEAMGRAAARILIDTTTGSQPADPVTLRLGTKLVVRESCGCGG